ncbi:MAG: MFS transporter, partial [Micromonosporaceae bacterium]|nr:MFS transporter [Micromonosporaceae bacterium]
MLAIMVGAITSLFFPASPALAANCTPKEWETDWKSCANQLPPPSPDRDACLKAPIPGAPDTGLGGWFAYRTETSMKAHNPGPYIDYGYAGYSFGTYDISYDLDPTTCSQISIHPDYRFEHTIANGEFMMASAVIGASNALRERAWDPATMWSWADPLVERASRAIYTKVFTVFGAITVGIVGLYLIWRSRQADMNDSITTSGWAILVMLIATAVVVYPVFAANFADGLLSGSLNAIHGAVGPREQKLTPNNCPASMQPDCSDPRPPSERTSETVTSSILYKNWLRGTLGSADSEVAQKYGMALYDAKAFTWREIEMTRDEDSGAMRRNLLIKQKQDRWKKVAEQIRKEDPEAYEHLKGEHGMERVGAGFIALLAAIFFAFFDIVAALLILLGFLIFRWAVIAAPLIGTFAMLRPASASLKRLGNAVVAAMFSIVIFGAAAAVYLLAVDMIMAAPMHAWLQVMLIGLCGVAGWIAFRPFQRFTQLGGSGGSDAGSMGDRLLGRTRKEEEAPGTATGGILHQTRPETRADVVHAGTAPPGQRPHAPVRESAAEPTESE